MVNFFDYLFSTQYWPRRWNCGYWTDALGYTHIISDLAIFFAYYTIPCILIYFFSRLKGIALEKVFILFALFIFFCGLTHLDEAIIFYYPFYRFAALIKICTAAVSWATVIALIPYIKTVATMPKLQVINKQLAEKLEIEQDRLKLAFEGTSAGIWEWDLKNHSCFYSTTFLELLGYDSQINASSIDFFYSHLRPEDVKRFKDVFQKYVDLQRPFEIELPIKMKDGHYHWFQVNGKSNRKQHRFAGSIADINEKKMSQLEVDKLCEELKILNSDLIESNKTLEEFSYHLAHDLKEPIRGIGSYAAILKDNQSIDMNSKQMLTKISDLSEKSLERIDRILKYTMKKEERIELSYVNTATLIDVVEKEVTFASGEFELIRNGDFPEIVINPLRIKEVFINLITNALKYNNKTKKSIHIECTENNEEYQFSINDNGWGIPKDEIKSVFSMFFRGAKTSEKDGGTGLGLAIVKRIITSYGGRIWLESEPGIGTTFYFTIPKLSMNDSLEKKTQST